MNELHTLNELPSIEDFASLPAEDHLDQTSLIVCAYVSNNPMPACDLPGLIASVHAALGMIASGTGPAAESETPREPAVPIKKSITPDFIVCLEDGKKFKSLRRHLSTQYGLSPAEYREKRGLPHDYPMVAPSYSAVRSGLAKKIGLGVKPATAVVQ